MKLIKKIIKEYKEGTITKKIDVLSTLLFALFTFLIFFLLEFGGSEPVTNFGVVSVIISVIAFYAWVIMWNIHVKFRQIEELLKK